MGGRFCLVYPVWNKVLQDSGSLDKLALGCAEDLWGKICLTMKPMCYITHLSPAYCYFINPYYIYTNVIGITNGTLNWGLWR